MTATRTRRRPVAMAVAVVLAVTVLAGCSGQKDPGSYTGQVKTSFKAACWTQRVLDAEPNIKVNDNDSLDQKSAEAQKGAPKAVVKAAQDYCGCVLKVILKKVHFSEFRGANDDLRDNGKGAGKLPKKLVDAYKSCADGTTAAASESAK